MLQGMSTRVPRNCAGTAADWRWEERSALPRAISRSAHPRRQRPSRFQASNVGSTRGRRIVRTAARPPSRYTTDNLTPVDLVRTALGNACRLCAASATVRTGQRRRDARRRPPFDAHPPQHEPARKIVNRAARSFHSRRRRALTTANGRSHSPHPASVSFTSHRSTYRDLSRGCLREI